MAEPIKNHDAAHGSYEHQDLHAKSVIYFFVALAVFLLVIYLISFGIYHALDSINEANKTTMSPMVAPKADTRTVDNSDTQAFPEPRLETSERTQLRTFIEDQDSKLATYNWVDKDKGVVQIPIDRAMDLIVQRGLPVRPQGAKQDDASQPEGQQQKEGSSAR
jgi:hypothetical protein